MTVLLPRAGAPLTEGGGPPTREHYRWCQIVTDAVNSGQLSGTTAQEAIAAIATALGSPDGTVENIPAQNEADAAFIEGSGSLNVFGTLAEGRVQLSLTGDVRSPGASFVYGTDADGERTWRYAPIESLVAGANITIDDTDPAFPIISAGGGDPVISQDTAPALPCAQPLWFNTATLAMSYQYDDGDSVQWVEPAVPSYSDADALAAVGAALTDSATVTWTYDAIAGTYTATAAGGGGSVADTDDVPEGAANLYHTTARASAAAPIQSVVGGTGVSVDVTDPANPVVNATGGGSGAMTLIGTTTVAGAAATTITMSSLDLAAHGEYLVEFSLANATASVVQGGLYFNGDTTATNYYRQATTFNTSSVGTTRANNADTFSMIANGFATGSIRIIAGQDGKPTAITQYVRSGGSAMLMQLMALEWQTAANVTSLTLSSSVASGFAIGSYFKVWGIN